MSRLERPAKLVRHAMRLVRTAPGAHLEGLRSRDLYRDVETCCLFVGYPRSGHSLVGSLVDAHPHAVLAHELDLLAYVYARFGRSALCALMVESSRVFTERGRTWSGYSYAVPGQWQGRFETIRVIGDKHGESTSIRLKLTPRTLDRLERTLRARVKLVHVVRNPFDNVATIERNIGDIARERIEPRGSPLLDAVAYYRMLAESVVYARDVLGADVLDVRHESLIAAPEAELERVCRFLGLEPPPGYLRACASIVFPSPRRTRLDTRWDPRATAEVNEAIERFPFLSGYSFDS